MIKEKLSFSSDKTVLDQILKANEMTYRELSTKLQITERTLQRIRKGEIGLNLSMSQLKLFQSLLEPFDKKLEDLPNDWIIENKKSVS